MSKTTDQPGLDPQSAIRFWQQAELRARFIALGVAVIIAATGAAVIISPAGDGLTGAIFLLGAAIGVALLVYPHLRYKAPHRHRRVPIAEKTQALAQQERRAYQPSHTVGTVFGIGMCVVSLAPAAILDDNLGGGLFMLCVAIGVFFLIYVNLIAGGYKRLSKPRARLR